MIDAVIGIGANLANRAVTMQAAVDRLARDRRARVVSLSSVYATAPVGPPQPEYLNAAVRVAFEGSPEALLALLLEVERALGRIRGTKWGPRTIDLDVLWIDGRVVDLPSLRVPHPHLLERPFALRPLADVAPDARDPRTGERLATRAPPREGEDDDLRLTTVVLVLPHA